MSPKKKAPSILGRAMLSHVLIGLWTARRYDQDVTDKVNQDMNANANAGRYRKRLLGEATSLSALNNTVQVARKIHKAQTLPWEDSGWRLLPTANYFQYTEAMRKAKARFEEGLDVFLQQYPKLVRNAPEALGQMFRREDYPTVDEVARKFHFDIRFGPVPTSDDFRVQLPKKELAAMAKSVEQRVADSVADAMAEAWQRLGDAVADLRPKLDDGKFLRESMITRLGELVETLGRLNLTDDPKLEQARKVVMRDLGSLDVDGLKENSKLRADAARKADAILKKMSSVYSPG